MAPPLLLLCAPVSTRGTEAAVHPSTRLVVWLLVLVTIQALAGTLLVAALLLLSLSGTAALRRCLQLAWRARWLFVSLSVILAWGGSLVTRPGADPWRPVVKD